MYEMLNRYSVKEYLDKNVDEALISQMIDIINSSPTSINGHHFSVTFITDSKIREALSNVGSFSAHVKQAPIFAIFNLDLNGIKNSLAIQNKEVDENMVQYLIVSSIVDATISSAMLQDFCWSKGLGTCYIGSVRHDMKNVRKILDYPPNVFPIVGLTIGYAKDEKIIKPKLNKVMINKYDANLFNEASLKSYDQQMSDFYISKNKQPLGHTLWLSIAYGKDSNFAKDLDVLETANMISKDFFFNYFKNSK